MKFFFSIFLFLLLSYPVSAEDYSLPYEDVVNYLVSDDIAMIVTKDPFENNYITIDKKTMGPYQGVYFLTTEGKAWGYAFIANNGGYANINGKEFGPYKGIYSLKVTSNNWGFCYTTIDENYGCNVNGKIYSFSYTEVKSSPLLDISRNHWVLQYDNEDKLIIITDEGQFEMNPGRCTPSFSNKFTAFDCIDFDTNDRSLYIKGKIYGPLESMTPSVPLKVSPDGGFLYSYNKYTRRVDNSMKSNSGISVNGRTYIYEENIRGDIFSRNQWWVKGSKMDRKTKQLMQYVRINGKEFGPYFSISDVQMSGKNWGFVYQKDNAENSYINIKGKEFGPYKPENKAYKPIQLTLTDNHWGAIITTSSSYDAVIVIDGKTYATKKFISLVMSGDDWAFRYQGEPLQRYFKKSPSIDDSMYLNLNGKIYGPGEGSISSASDGVIAVIANYTPDIDKNIEYMTNQYYIPSGVKILTTKKERNYLDAKLLEEKQNLSSKAAFFYTDDSGKKYLSIIDK